MVQLFASVVPKTAENFRALCTGSFELVKLLFFTIILSFAIFQLLLEEHVLPISINECQIVELLFYQEYLVQQLGRHQFDLGQEVICFWDQFPRPGQMPQFPWSLFLFPLCAVILGDGSGGLNLTISMNMNELLCLNYRPLYSFCYLTDTHKAHDLISMKWCVR